MIRPSPLPEELDPGYFGRVMHINGFQSEKETVDTMEKMFGSESVQRRKRTRLELLSSIAGQSVEAFTRAHSTIPLRRAITTYLPDLPHGSPRFKAGFGHLEPERSGAYLCPACVSEDVMFHGFSYWRRDHQMLGQYSCPKHRTALHYVRDKKDFLQFPSMIVEESQAVPTAFADEALNNEFVTRFLDIASEMSVRPASVASTHVNFMIDQRMVDIGMRSWPGETAPCLIDVIQQSFPRNWLLMVSPGFSRENFVQRQFEFLYGRHTRRGERRISNYILALAVLFDSSEEALNALFKASEDFEKMKAATRHHNAKPRKPLGADRVDAEAA